MLSLRRLGQPGNDGEECTNLMQQAVRTAEASVPGAKAKETHPETEGGRTVYEVELVDNTNNTRTVWVDAQNGRIVKTDK